MTENYEAPTSPEPLAPVPQRESAHTPGPWIAVGTTPNEQIIREENGDVVAIVPHNMPRKEYEANARLIAAAPDLKNAGTKLDALICGAQAILTSYLIPDGIDAAKAINDLLGLLDGPVQRDAQNAWRAAIAKATPSPTQVAR